MKRVLAIVLATAVGASLAFATGTVTTLPEKVRNALTSIDIVPTKNQLAYAFGTQDPANVLSNLSTIAKDKEIDIGVRLRAIHALAKYCTDPCTTSELAHQSLTTLITDLKNETIGEPIVLLRAAIETIGTLRVDTDASVLIPLLDHPSRDIRAATARALRDLCNNQAINPLRVRYTSEPTDQVKLAISEALRILGQCGL